MYLSRYTPITEVDFYDIVFVPVYDPNGTHENTVASHSLAVLYMVLALGTLMDLDRPSHSSEATHYYQLARAALSLDSIFEEQTITGIQALVSRVAFSRNLSYLSPFKLLMCHFMFLNNIEGPRWAIMGLVVKLAHSVSTLSGFYFY